MMFRQACAAAVLAATLLPAAQANLLANPSFETGAFVGGSFGYPLAMQLGNGSTAITGWVVGAELAWIRTGMEGITPTQGQYALDLTGFCDMGYNGPGYCPAVGPNGYGTMSQAISTVVGATYSLSFDAGTYGVSTAAPTVVASAGGTTQSFVLPGQNVPATGVWEKHQFNFVATAASTTVSFGGSGGAYGGTYYLGLDNTAVELVSLPVPEPGSAALFLVGGGLLSLRCRRSKRAAASAQPACPKGPGFGA